jgi:uncharacterized protein (TIGR02001 family)
MLSNMKKFAVVAGSAAVLALGTGTAARADDAAPAFGYTWTITGASDYLFRGISYTQSDPTVNSYLEATYGILYVGLWTSNIHTCNNANGCLGPWEQDVYVGIRPVTGPVSWDLAALYYHYGTRNPIVASPKVSEWDTDYVELKASGTVTPVTNLSLTGTVYYTPDQDLASPENVSVEGTVAYTLPAMGIFTPTISGQVGFSDASTNAFYGTSAKANPTTGFFGYWNGDDQYVYWNAGVKLAVEKFTFDLRYWDTNIPTAVANNGTGAGNSDSRFFFSMAVTLP